MSDTTLEHFPSYADLTQTQAWAARPAPIAHTPIGADISRGSRYTEQAVLGVGGMGKVLLAKDERIGRAVAVKVMRSERELAPEEHARFLREAQVQGQLEHPSIVPVYDIDRRDDGTTFFTMRRVLGETLHAILEQRRIGAPKHTLRELLHAFATVCLAVDYAHSRGVVHRDLKPANIMLGDFGEVYVLDWGVARILDDPATDVHDSQPVARLSTPGSMLGTPLYMAPEQMMDPEVGVTADVFALGAILFEIMTLERLRDADPFRAPIDARASVRAPHREVPPELETVCVKATQLRATDRYASARELQEAVARYLDGDRELEQRRAIARTHADRARESLHVGASDLDIDGALVDLTRAIALDPTGVEHVAMLADALRTPPRTPPPEIERHLAAGTQAVLHSGARYTAFTMTSWFVFLPLMLAAGVRRWDFLAAIAIVLALTVALALVAIRQTTIGHPIQYVMTVLVAGACGLVTLVFGPLVLVPTLASAAMIVLQAHPERRFRRFGLVATTSAMLVPVLLEATGITRAYDFTTGFTVLPQMIDLPQAPTIMFLALASASMVMPAIYIGRLRAELTASQRRELLHTWRLRRLGENIVRVG